MPEALEDLKKALEGFGKAEPKQFKKKLDKILQILGSTNIKCNRIYNTDLMKLIISSREKGEQPQILVVRTLNEKRGEEIQLIYLGKHHVEDLTYFNSNPKKWNSKRFGYMILTPDQAISLAEMLSKVKMEFEPFVGYAIFPFQVYCWRIETI